MYRQASEAIKTLGEQSSRTSATSTETASSDTDFDISSPIIDTGDSSEQNINNTSNTQQSSSAASTENVILDSITKVFGSEAPVPEAQATTAVPPLSQEAVKKVGTKPTRKSISSLDLETRKALLSSFKPKVRISRALLKNKQEFSV